MIHEHCNSKPYIYHYTYIKDRTVPIIYAVFELFTLGNLVFHSLHVPKFKYRSSKTTKIIPQHLIKSKDILGDIIDCMKGLRNAIAHNGVLL